MICKELLNWGWGWLRAGFFGRSCSQAALASWRSGLRAPFTINDALRMAVQTNPSIGEAAANRRATEAELRQTQSTLLPQVRLEASAGPEKLNNPATFPLNNITPTLNNGQWVAGAQGSVFIRQLLFDGFTSLHESVAADAARVDAAAARTHERSELTALDASEPTSTSCVIPALSRSPRKTSAAHRTHLGEREQRFQGGRAGQGDLEQTTERVDAAEVTLTEFRRSLEDARSNSARSSASSRTTCAARAACPDCRDRKTRSSR